ncbi:MAG: CBS domain-containing protein [Syntrophales bacterium]|nr:CBS domain-containing protein [Syntrophales bacterium]
MIKAKDIMTERVITVYPDTEITKAAALLLEKHINGLPVIDREGFLKGIICQSDLMVQQGKIPLPSFFVLLGGTIPISSPKQIEKEVQKMAAVTVSEAMTADPVTVDTETSLEEIATLMVKNNIHTLPVLENGFLVGVIGKEDIIRTLIPDSGK